MLKHISRLVRTLCLASAALTVSTAASAEDRIVTSTASTLAQAQGIFDGLALGTYKCNDSALSVAEDTLNIVYDGALSTQRALADPSLPSYSRKLGLYRYEALAQLSARSQIDAADKLLAAHCDARADAWYRTVIGRFTGPQWAALRERARIGVDDIRNRKPAD